VYQIITIQHAFQFNIVFKLPQSRLCLRDPKIIIVVDDDSEPILGHWFEETLSPEEPPVTPSQQSSKSAPQEGDGEDTEEQKRTHRLSSSDSPCLILDKRDPEGVSLDIDLCVFCDQG
jgi:hypothetical protein